MISQLIDNRYQILQVLGPGSMADTYLTRDLHTASHSVCVVKRLPLGYLDPEVLTAKRELFAREAACLKTLGFHRQIPQFLNYCEHQEECYLAQEFIDGYSLAEVLYPGRRWPVPRVIQFLDEMLGLLTFVHRQGIIHRDIKPSNIMCREADNQQVLIDFGAAMHVPDELPKFVRKPGINNIVVGTPGYMPIEQAHGRPQLNSDVYSLGMIAIQALTGSPPRQLQKDEIGEWTWREHTEVSDELATVLSKMVRRCHKHRFNSATETLKAVKSLKGISSVTVRTRAATPDIISRSMTQLDATQPAEMISPADEPKASTVRVFPQASPSHTVIATPPCRRHPVSHRSILHRSIRALAGAAAIVLATACPGVPYLAQTETPIEDKQSPFNPQNFQKAEQ